MFSLIPRAETISPTVMQDTVAPAVNTGIPPTNSTLPPIDKDTFVSTPENSVNPRHSWTFAGSIVWEVGLAVLFGYAAFSYLRIRREVEEAVRLYDNVYICDAIKSPFILGVICPRIYLPSDIEDEQMDYVLAHEQAHLKRKDHWWKPFGYVLLTVYWFNPLVWAAYILLCRDIELACDEKAVHDLNMDERKAYSEALVTCSMKRRMIMACPIAFGEVGVKERVKAVLNYKKPAFWLIVVSVVVCVVVAICFLTNPKNSNNLEEMTDNKKEAELSIIQADKMIFKEAGYQGEPCYEFISKQGTTVILYSDSVSYNAYVVINGQQYLFAAESGFYVSAVIEPSILFFDGNQDGKTDIFIWANIIRFGMEQNAYLATDTGYRALGGMTWRMDAEEKPFEFEASYCDKYSVHVTVPEYGIDSEVPLTDEYFLSVAKEMGLFDKKGRVTKEGEKWNSGQNPYMAPFETNIECGMDTEGNFILRAYAPLYAGYSDCTTGAVFVQDFKLTDTGYQLNNLYLTKNLPVIAQEDSNDAEWNASDKQNLMLLEGLDSEVSGVYEGTKDLYYIVGVGEDSLFLDEVEWVTLQDPERAAELGLNDDDMPSGFYVYNEEETQMKCSFAEECSFTILDWQNGYHITKVDKQTFLDMIDSREFLPPFHISIVDGKMVNIYEQYVP